jgi:methionine sulfoxide reductase heme-binding subunit
MLSRRLAYATALGLSASALVASAVLKAQEGEFWHFATRWTARAAFVMLLLVFVSRPLRLPWVSLARRHWGLGFAVCHGIHLVCITVYTLQAHLEYGAATLIGGGLGFVFTALLALTSSDAWQRRLGRAWGRLHLTGLYYLWLIFTLNYVGRLSDPEGFWIGALAAPVAVGALALRLIVPRLRARTQVRLSEGSPSPQAD